MERTTDRTRRTTRGISGTVIAMMTLPTPAPVSEMRAIARSTPGIAITPSITRITTVSTQRTYPARSPIVSPPTTLIAATARPTVSEIRVP